MTLREHVSFARQPTVTHDGVLVFLPDDVIGASDEYRDGNPYRNAATKESSWDQFRVQMILENVVGANVLDLGSGEGELSARLAERFKVEGLDYSISAVRQARHLVPSARFVVADANEPPYQDGQFDTVVLGNLFEHVETPCLLLRASRRMLRPGGRLVMSTPSRYKTTNFRRALRGKTMVLNSTHHVTEYTPGQVKEMLRWCGFRFVSAQSNLVCSTTLGTVAARAMQGVASLIGSHAQFGDPTVYVAEVAEG